MFVSRPGISMAVEALTGLIQCVSLTASMTSLVSHRINIIWVMKMGKKTYVCVKPDLQSKINYTRYIAQTFSYL